MTAKPTAAWHGEFTIHSDTAEAKKITDIIRGILSRYGWADREIHHIHLSAEEAIINAIRHGNQNDVQKLVQVSAVISKKAVRIEVSDQGKGFDPASLPDPTNDEFLERPTGRGVYLINTLMDKVTFVPPNNHIVMTKTH